MSVLSLFYNTFYTTYSGNQVTAAITSGQKLLMDRAVSYVNTIFLIDDPALGDHNASDAYINYVHGMTATIVNGSFFHLPEVSISLNL